MTCSEIEERLQDYLEHRLSEAGKAAVDGHLSRCARCSGMYEDMKKTGEILRNLPQVDPPPFFEQRIVSRIRDEAAQKPGFLRRLFYPLHIKVPLQAFATLLIAVMAFSIYRTVMPELTDLAPPPVTAPQPERDPIRAESRTVSSAPAAVSKAGGKPAEGPAEKKQRRFVAPPFERDVKDVRADAQALPQSEERSAMTMAAVPGGATREKESPPVRTQTPQTTAETSAKRQAGRSPEAAPADREGKGMAPPAGAAPAPLPATDPAVPRRFLDLVLHTGDGHAAVREIERHLARFGGRVIEKRHTEKGVILQAELGSPDLAAFVEQIGTIGRVEAEKSPRDLSGRMVTIRIRITGEP